MIQDIYKSRVNLVAASGPVPSAQTATMNLQGVVAIAPSTFGTNSNNELAGRVVASEARQSRVQSTVLWIAALRSQRRKLADFIQIVKFIERGDKRRFVITTGIFLFLFILCQGTGIAASTMQVEPEQINVNDTFHLMLTSDNAQSGGLPNLTPLQNDFTILGTERSLSYSMVNGQTNSRSQWIILLRPKKVGKLVIPAIKIGQEQTQSGVINVSGEGVPSTSPDQVQSGADGLMLKTEVNTPNPYVNQQVLYTVKLLSNAQLLNAEYHPPSVENALMIPLGDGRHYQTQVNGELYAVEEQQYAIFPQKSGPLTLHPPSFQAAVYDQVPRRVTVEAKTTPINVRPAPTDYQGINWLPAKKITLAEVYDPPKQTMQEGDTLTRTVTLTAVSMPAQLLPALTFAANDDFNVYPESPEVKNTVRQNELLGTSTMKVTYLLNRDGRITIPALEVPWFNTETGKTEITSLPAHTLMVKANKAAQPAKASSSLLGKASSLSSKTTKTSIDNTTTTPALPRSFVWAFVTGFGLAFGLMGLVWWLWPGKGVKRNSQSSAAIKRLEDACQKNRPIHARDALLAWARSQWPEAKILNLNDIAILTRDASLKKHLQALTQVLYHSKQTAAWEGDGLWRCFNAYRQLKPGKTQKASTRLPPINPV